ncbi:methylated-DNA--[protein]-cysteine S-methyltransferase [Micrococcus sp. KRD128]|uniref:methylated-DNA--[protein]-cysteine S-methyltransferase n=1 Tax=Micrococcus sp. KRD128 TaxID=2729722 RepID=UPI00237A1448|nr:MGMT family protein [Micrococcus sp. KRD128]
MSTSAPLRPHRSPRSLTNSGITGNVSAGSRTTHANPVAVVVPCHRVVRADGAAGHYLYGTAAKQALLAHEAAHAG